MTSFLPLERVRPLVWARRLVGRDDPEPESVGVDTAPTPPDRATVPAGADPAVLGDQAPVVGRPAGP
ncbi:hypothetical protein NKG94_30640 [Micromonospora sp. M12]